MEREGDRRTDKEMTFVSIFVLRGFLIVCLFFYCREILAQMGEILLSEHKHRRHCSEGRTFRPLLAASQCIAHEQSLSFSVCVLVFLLSLF